MLGMPRLVRDWRKVSLHVWPSAPSGILTRHTDGKDALEEVSTVIEGLLAENIVRAALYR